MAEKRGKDRVILKLIGLHGVVYSEEEADEMRDDIKRQRLASSQARRSSDKPRAETSRPAEEQATISVNGSVVDFPGQAAIDNNIEASVRKSIDSAETINAVTNVMLKPDTQRSLADLPQSVRDELRNYAKARLVALGWPEKKGA